MVLELDAFHDYVMKIVVRKGNEVTFADKPGDLYSLISPLEARSGFPRALAAIRANPKLAGQPMRGHGSGSSWLPLHCLLLLGPKFQGWWWPLAEPLFQSLLSANPRAAQQRVLDKYYGGKITEEHDYHSDGDEDDAEDGDDDGEEEHIAHERQRGGGIVPLVGSSHCPG